MIWYINEGQTGAETCYGQYSGNAYYFRNDVEYTVALSDIEQLKTKFGDRIKVMGDDYLRVTGTKTGTVEGATRTYTFTGKPVNVLKEDVDAVIAFQGT